MVICPSCNEEIPARFRFCGYCGVSLTAPEPTASRPRVVRKTVTIVFCDLKGSTTLGERLDPEALHEVKDLYFDAMAGQITRHGGKIEKYIGDAIMAVFGLPTAHEDDALRAVRAAAGMQSALVQVNQELERRYGVSLANRTGVNTGEVVANDDPTADQKLATGDAVNVAARLEQAAPTNGIYLGESTYRLVRDAVEVEPVEPLELKGKSEPVPAYRLLSAQGLEGNTRRHDTPLVGRDDELAAIDQTLREVAATRSARLVTIIGDAGIGKSRLAREIVVRAGASARVLRGRCLPYGDGVTFWPLREMAFEAAGVRPDDLPEVALARLAECVGDADVCARLAVAAGLSDTAFPMHELFWGARKFFEKMAAGAPLVALVDDIHWAQSAFRDLLEQVLDTARDSAVLLLATARHDLLERHPQWGERPFSLRLVLRPLTDQASARVAQNLFGSTGLPPDTVARIVAAAEGNPLYVEQLLSMLVDSQALRRVDGAWVRVEGRGDIDVPPTIKALLEARLGQLGIEERAVIGPASVIGMEFPSPAIESMVPAAQQADVEGQLGELNRKRFVQTTRTADEVSVYRFHHHLVRETVYGGLLKRQRAALHIDFVRWADRVNADRHRALEFEEILGYHLEQAHRCLVELGPLDELGVAIGVDAAKRLSGAGRRAFARGDMKGAASLMQRAVALLAVDSTLRLALLPELGEVLMGIGQFAAARELVSEALDKAVQIGDRRLEAGARIIGMFVRLYSGEAGDWGAQALQVGHEAIPVLEALGAHNDLASAWRLIAFVHGVAGRYSQANAATVHYMAQARLSGNMRLVGRSALGFASGALLGPTPVREAIAECQRIVDQGLPDRRAQSVVQCVLARLRAMNGEFDEARRLYRQGRQTLHELGQRDSAASTGINVAHVEWLAGDLQTAEREARADYDFLVRKGETYHLSSMAAVLARIVRDAGRDDDALALTQVVEQTAAAEDVEAQAQWRSFRAPIVARSGDLVAAEALARAAIEMALRSDAPLLHADTLCDLAEVLRLSGQQAAAQQTIADAIQRYADKGDTVSAARAAAWAASGPPGP